jgi:hypothetical protein
MKDQKDQLKKNYIIKLLMTEDFLLNEVRAINYKTSSKSRTMDDCIC